MLLLGHVNFKKEDNFVFIIEVIECTQNKIKIHKILAKERY